jgi:hypothetical protein
MTFLEICQEANYLCGMQGVVSSVTVTSGYQEILVKFVIDAYNDLQVYRKDWPWMRSSVTFNTVQSTTEYSLQTIVGIGNPINIKRWVPGGIYYLDTNNNNDRVRLYSVSYNRYLTKNMDDDDENKPYAYAEDPIDNHLYLNPPDGVYTIEAHFYTVPTILAANSDVPLCPPSFHRLIAYMGARRMAGFMGNANLYNELTTQADVMLGNLLRAENPAKRVRLLGIA